MRNGRELAQLVAEPNVPAECKDKRDSAHEECQPRLPYRASGSDSGPIGERSVLGASLPLIVNDHGDLRAIFKVRYRSKVCPERHCFLVGA